MTDFRALCAELLEALEYEGHMPQDKTWEGGLVAQARAALAQPEPPSLKQQALEAMREMQIQPCVIDGIDVNAALQVKYDIIRRALEALPDDIDGQS